MVTEQERPLGDPALLDLVIPHTRIAPGPLPVWTIDRPDLVRTLRRRRDARIVRVCAPPGWGKTTLLTQWRAAELDDGRERDVCWLTVDPADRTVERFLAALVESFEIGSPGFRLRWTDVAPTTGVDSVATVIPIVVDELTLTGSRLLIMLDDLDAAPPPCLEAVGYLLRLLPADVQVAYSTTERLPLHIAKWRVRGEVAEVGTDQLRLGPVEAGQMARAIGSEFGDALLETMVVRTAGWPAGVAAAVQMAAASPSPHELIGGLTGRDRRIAQLLEDAVIRRLDEADLEMMVTSSILEHLDGPLVDVVTGSTDAADRLDRLSAPGGFVVRVDDDGPTYRCHGLLRDALRARLLATAAPDRLRDLHRRAAVELARAGRVTESIEHSVMAGEVEVGALALVGELPRLIGDAAFADLRTGVEHLQELGGPPCAPLSICAALLHSLTGASEQAAADLRAAERAEWVGAIPGGLASVADAVAIVGGALLDGVVRPDVRHAAVGSAPVGSPWTTLAQYAAGRGAFLAGDRDQARLWFERATGPRPASAADPSPAEHLFAAMSAAYLAIVHAEDGCEDEARRAFEAASDRLGGPAWRILPAASPLHLARGVIALAALDPEGAEPALEAALACAPAGGSSAFHARLELTRAAEFRGDLECARHHLAAAELLAPNLRDCDLLQRRCSALGRLLHPVTLSQAGLVSPITDGEMAVLRRVPTGLTQVEIAARLHVSVNTVKSHLRSIYQKLGVSSRPAAARRARELGLLLDE